jgi:hypothetical protein
MHFFTAHELQAKAVFFPKKHAIYSCLCASSSKDMSLLSFIKIGNKQDL